MKIIAPAILALALAGLGAPALAQEDASREDLRCILVLGIAQQQAPDAAARDRARSAFVYYLGRLDGREASLDLGKSLAEEAKAFKPADGPALLTKCGTHFSERGRALQAAAGAVRTAIAPN